jgi:hypothetical protein
MRGKRVIIKNFEAKCPYDEKINLFRPSQDRYGKLVGAIDVVERCKHLTNWFKDAIGTSTVYARFEKEPEWRSIYTESGKLI